MRTILLTVMTILLGSALLAQTNDTSAAARKQSRASTKEIMEAQKKETDVKSETESGARRRKMDRFVDEDGDGICDHRASGLGLRQQLGPKAGKGEMRKGMQEAPGKKQHRGGGR